MIIVLLYLTVAFMFYAYCVVYDYVKVGWTGGQKFPLNCLATSQPQQRRTKMPFVTLLT
ncbi:hypothetical protein VPHF86_0220 [Vibrio phage F86]